MYNKLSDSTSFASKLLQLTLGANIRALVVQGSGVVHLIKEFYKLSIFNFGWVECNLDGFGMTRNILFNLRV